MSNLSIHEEVLVLQPGEERRFNYSGDYIRLITGDPTVLVSFNNTGYIPYEEGLMFNGPAGEGWLKSFAAKNASGSVQTCKLRYGTGNYNIIGKVTIANPQFTLDSTTQDYLRGLPQTVHKFTDTKGAGTWTYSNLRGFEVINSGSTNITIDGAPFVPGSSWEEQCYGRFDVFQTLTVVVPTGGQAIISGKQ